VCELRGAGVVPGSDRSVPFCSSDAACESLFVEVTPATATAASALSWLVANVGSCLPADYALAFDIELDVAAVRCAGVEWWTLESQPADGLAPGARELWRFDVREALTLTPVSSIVADDDPGVPQEALEALTAYWSAGRVSDEDHRQLLVLSERQAVTLDRFAQRRDAAPAGAPRVELADDERFAVLLLFEHVVRLLAPLLETPGARDLLLAGLPELERQRTVEAARAHAELERDLVVLPQAVKRDRGASSSRSRRWRGRR
jgi:hypothetical protein